MTDVLRMHDSGERKSGLFVMMKIKRRQVGRGKNNCVFPSSGPGNLT